MSYKFTISVFKLYNKLMLAIDEYKPEVNQFPDTAGLYPYTFNANPSNSAERLQALADMAGFTIYAADFMGQQDGSVMGVPAREALQPGDDFAMTCHRQATALHDTVFVSYQHRIGIGDALGVTAITGTHRFRLGVPSLYDAVQLRDGFNLRRAQKVRSMAYASFLGYQIADVVHGRLAKDVDDRATKTNQLMRGTSQLSPPNPDNPSVLANMRNLGALMQSDESIKGSRALARDTSMPLHVVGLRHGLSGTEPEVHHFFDLLEKVRHDAIHHVDYKRKSPDVYPVAAPLLATYEPGWHADILDPVRGARHLRATRALLVDNQ